MEYSRGGESRLEDFKKMWKIGGQERKECGLERDWRSVGCT